MPSLNSSTYAEHIRGLQLSRQLFTVGPVHVDPEVLKAMTRPMITHRSQEYKDLHAGIEEKLHKALDTDDDIFMVSGSATVLLEGAARNGICKKSLGLSNGSFGNRSIDVAELNGKTVDKVCVPWGKAIRPQHIAGKVKDDTEAVHWVSNESSTGVMNDSLELAEAVRDQNPDALIMIDAVTSAFATDLNLKKLQPDSLVFGSQKALALPPGMAFISVSDKMMEKSRSNTNRGFYTDFVKLKAKNDVDYALTTPPVSLMYALDFQLDRMLKDGMANRYRRNREMRDMLCEWSEKKLHGMFPEEGFRSLTAAVLNRGGLDFDRFHSILKSKGYEISNGYGDIKKDTFRVGFMGDITPNMLRKLLKVMDETLEEM